MGKFMLNVCAEGMVFGGRSLGKSVDFQTVSHLGALRYYPREDFPGGTVVKNLPANVGDMGSSPGPGRSHLPRSN